MIRVIRPDYPDIRVIRPRYPDIRVIRPDYPDIRVIRPRYPDIRVIRPDYPDIRVIRPHYPDTETESKQTDLLIPRPRVSRPTYSYRVFPSPGMCPHFWHIPGDGKVGDFSPFPPSASRSSRAGHPDPSTPGIPGTRSPDQGRGKCARTSGPLSGRPTRGATLSAPGRP